MKLAILLTTGLEAEDGHTVRQLSRAALQAGYQVDLFLMDDGVYHLSRLKDLLPQGLRITMCTHNAMERGIAKEELPGLLFGGQPDWAGIVSAADRVITFG